MSKRLKDLIIQEDKREHKNKPQNAINNLIAGLGKAGSSGSGAVNNNYP